MINLCGEFACVAADGVGGHEAGAGVPPLGMVQRFVFGFV